MRTVVIGGSIAGLSAALALTDAGHDVLILESDDGLSPPAGEDPGIWRRSGVPHGLQAHAFHAGFSHTLKMRAPDVFADLIAAGARASTFDDMFPRVHADRTLKPGDDRFLTLSIRRPLAEAVVRAAVLRRPRVDVRSGVRIRSIRTRMRDGIPHMNAAIADTGDVIEGDVFFDATGRKTRVDAWLRAAGVRAPVVTSEPCDQLYFTRHYRLSSRDQLPAFMTGYATAIVYPWGAVILFNSDSDTLQVAITTLPEDDAVASRLRFGDAFQAFASMTPIAQEWVDPIRAKPLAEPSVMAGLNNMLRRMVVDGRPVVTGLHLIGDSACTTNPQYGRGVSHALLSSYFMAGVLADHADDPVAQALAADREAERMLQPSFRDSTMHDRVRSAVWRSGLTGEPPDLTGLARPYLPDLFAAGFADSDEWRRFNRGASVLEPPGSWRDDPVVCARIIELAATVSPPAPARLPVRADVLDALARASSR